mmetsp:Transcript_5615/g.25309  ORF Transcript_5615/g.25309 Transcript_5615/m.25309 type:complete len:324 (+) Transcript_5615:1180-2151(+)
MLFSKSAIDVLGQCRPPVRVFCTIRDSSQVVHTHESLLGRHLVLVRVLRHLRRPLPTRHGPRRRLHVIHPRVVRHSRHRPRLARAALAVTSAGRTQRHGRGGRPWNVHAVLLEVITRDDVDEKVEDVRLGDGGGDVVALERPPLVLLAVDPRTECELQDEHLARLCEQHRRLRRYHPDVLVGLHDLLDPRQRELVVLEVAAALNLLHLLLPEHAELLLVLLVDVMRLHVVRLDLRLLQLRRPRLLLPLLLRVGVAGVRRGLRKLLTVGLPVDHGHARGCLHVAAGGTALAALALSLLHADVFCFIESLSRGSVSSLHFTSRVG